MKVAKDKATACVQLNRMLIKYCGNINKEAHRACDRRLILFLYLKEEQRKY